MQCYEGGLASSSFSSNADTDSVVVSDVDLPASLSDIDAEHGTGDSSPSSALAAKVNNIGDVALKALDLTFFVAEKVVEETPKVKEEVRKAHKFNTPLRSSHH